jgi:hypothetical protein
MTDRLREAIGVARTGETDEAQRLVAAILENSPDDARAWYLMSHLVESPARQAAYLYKAVSLDPSNERARAELARFPSGVTYALSRPPDTATPSSSDLVSPVAMSDSYREVESIGDQPESLPQLEEEMAPQELILPMPTGERSDLNPMAAGGEVAADIALTPEVTRRRQRTDGPLITVLAVLVILTAVVLGFLGYLLLR